MSNREKQITDDELVDILKQHRNHTGSWKEFALLMNELLNRNYDESAYRKPIQNYERITMRLGMSDAATNIKLKQIYAKKELTLNKKIKDTQFYNKEFNQIKKEVYNIENLLSIVMEATKPLPAPKELDLTYEQYDNSKMPIFIISDMQEDGSGFCNEIYDRVEKEMVARIKQEKLKEIYILENGDGIEGVLRVSALYDNHGGYVKQLAYYQKSLAKLLNNVSKHCKVNFSIINSNHTEIRPFGAQRGAIKDEDLTYLILAYLKATLELNKNIVFLQTPQTPKDLNYNILDINGYKIFQHHGDNSGSSPKNAENYYNKIIRYYDRHIDLVLVAHYHHFCFKTINRLEHGGDSVVMHSPALDPRQVKSNEQDMMLSSEPAFLRIDIEKGKGITKVELIKTGIYLK